MRRMGCRFLQEIATELAWRRRRGRTQRGIGRNRGRNPCVQELIGWFATAALRYARKREPGDFLQERGDLTGAGACCGSATRFSCQGSRGPASLIKNPLGNLVWVR